MSVTVAPIAVAERRSRTTLRERMQQFVPKLVLAPSFLLVLIFVYGFNLWTVFLSFTNSRAFTSFTLVGLANYEKLWNWTFETDPPSSCTPRSSTSGYSAGFISSSVSRSA